MRRFTLALLGAAAATLAIVELIPTRAICGGAQPVISFATLNGYCVGANVLHYVASLAAAFVIAALLRPPKTSATATGSAQADFFILALAAVVAINAGLESSLAAPLVDTFHEGEALAFTPAFARALPFKNTVLVHGFGIDVLPALLAKKLYAGSAIAGMRLFKAFEATVFFAGLLWALFEVFAFEPDARRRRTLQLLAVGVAVPLLSLAGFGHELLRKSVEILQFALLLRALRTDRGWTLSGALVPIALFYNYATGLAMILVLGAALLRRPRRIPLVALGGAFTGVLCLAAVGPAQVSEIVGQISYWGKTGGATWMLPVEDEWLQVALLFAPMVALQAMALVRFRRDEPDVWLSALLSLSAFRCWTDRADTVHLALAAIPTAPLLFALLQRSLPRPAEKPLRWHPALIPAALAMLGLVPLAPLSTLGPVAAVRKTLAALRDAHTPDAQLLDPALRSAAESVEPDVRHASCFFTMTSEGVWYHLFDKPSCSRFHHLVYARTDEAQRELVAALEREKPPVILGGNEMWSNHIDGVPTTVTNPVVWAYVNEHYELAAASGAHAFLRRTSDSLTASGH